VKSRLLSMIWGKALPPNSRKKFMQENPSNILSSIQSQMTLSTFLRSENKPFSPSNWEISKNIPVAISLCLFPAFLKCTFQTMSLFSKTKMLSLKDKSSPRTQLSSKQSITWKSPNFSESPWKKFSNPKWARP
jgi:hypothetical protein